MDSAIAPHLRRERLRPTRKGEDFQPPYPSFSARFPTTTVTVVMAYFGVQYPGDTAPAVAVEALAALRRDLSGEHGAGSVDLAAYVDEAGFGTRVVIAYWDDPDVFDAWQAAHPWTDAARAGRGVGFFTEVVRPGVERFETLFSSRRLDGVATLAEGLSDEIREHGYWGGARDRFPAAQDDGLEPDGEPVLAVDGPLRTVRAGVNPCLIRSGQEFGDTAGDERGMYLDDVEPHLRAGMDYLRDHGRDVGCYLNRYMTVADGDWNPTDETFGLSWWRGLEDLDTWAESHPTHLAIFGAAMKYLSTMGPAANLHLFHEVTVPGRGATEFVYLDCHDRTGMLRAVL